MKIDPKLLIFVSAGVILFLILIAIGFNSLQEPEQEEQNYVPTTSQIIDVCDAGNYIGQEMIVQGKVIEVSESKGTTFINFGSRYPNHCFYGVIFSSSSYKFPTNIKSSFEGKVVKISGFIEEYQGKPQIILENSEQIEVVR